MPMRDKPMGWSMGDARLWETHAYEMHACKIVHAYERHAYAMGPLRSTSMRDAPTR